MPTATTVTVSDRTTVNANFGTSRYRPVSTSAMLSTPATFPTTLANDGARHVIAGNTLFLGATRDAEANGQSSAGATGDGADEDGIVISGGSLRFGVPVSVTVTASVPSSAVINGWVDFNGDGDWDDPGERLRRCGHHQRSQRAEHHGSRPSSVASPIARFRLGDRLLVLRPRPQRRSGRLPTLRDQPHHPQLSKPHSSATASRPRQYKSRLRSLQRFSPTLRLSDNVITLGNSSELLSSGPTTDATELTMSLLLDEEDAPADATDLTDVDAIRSNRTNSEVAPRLNKLIINPKC
ncbi:MAG: hypothetical protein R3B91_11030 [Planctomycetaceae bacterium]